MNVQIHAVHFSADKKLLNLVENKIEKFNQYHDKITKVDVYLKLDNTVHTIKDKVVEIKVKIPGDMLFKKVSTKSFEESLDEATSAMVNILKSKNKKSFTMKRRQQKKAAA